MRRRWIVGAAWLLACSTAPEVEVRTYLGEATPAEDPRAAMEQGFRVLAAMLPADGPKVSAQPQVIVHPPRDGREFEQLVDALRSAALEDIAGPAGRLAASGPKVWPEIRSALLADRPYAKGDYRSLLAAIGGDVPNRYGHFALRWKRAHGHRVTVSDDWYGDLLELPPARISGPLREVYRDTVFVTALLRAASEIGKDFKYTAEVIHVLLDAAYVHGGTFRDEVGRAIRAIGDCAIPPLVVESSRPLDVRDDAAIPVKRAEYAEVQLDLLDRLHPSRAVAAIRNDPRLLVALFEAYGRVRPVEAAEVLLEHVDAQSPRLRAVARKAFSAYVTGPPPQAIRKTVRLLGGKTATARAYLSHRQRAALAIRNRLEQQAPELCEPPCESVRPDGEPDESCAQQPERLTSAYFGWLDARRHQQNQRLVDEALAEPDFDRALELLDRLLLFEGARGHEARLVARFQDAAERASVAENYVRAGRLLRKSAMLAATTDPQRAATLTVKALLAESKVPTLEQRGREMLLRTASDLAPDDPTVAAGRTELDSQAEMNEAGLRRRLALGVFLLAVALGCWTALTRRFRPWVLGTP